MLEALKLLHVAGPLSEGKIASMSCSGGEASLIADLAGNRTLCFPPLNKTQKGALQQILGPQVALANPLDYHTYIWGDTEAMSGTFTAMMAGEAALGLVILDFPRLDRCTAEDWLKVVDATQNAAQRSGKPMAILSTLAETLPEEIASRLIESGSRSVLRHG